MSIRRFMNSAAIVAVTLSGVVASATKAEAAFIVTMTQVGNDVVATGTGSINLMGLSLGGSISGVYPQLAPIVALMMVGPANSSISYYYASPLNGPTSFGPGTNAPFASSGSGDFAEVQALAYQISVPLGYVSNAPLSSVSTWANSSFASLGITPGTYTWTWGGGDTADSFTLDVVAVPEPTSLAVVGAGLAVVGAARRRKRS